MSVIGEVVTTFLWCLIGGYAGWCAASGLEMFFDWCRARYGRVPVLDPAWRRIRDAVEASLWWVATGRSRRGRHRR